MKNKKQLEIGIIIILGIIVLSVIIYSLTKSQVPILKAEDKIEMIADHLRIKFRWVAPEKGYWKVVKLDNQYYEVKDIIIDRQLNNNIESLSGITNTFLLLSMFFSIHLISLYISL